MSYARYQQATPRRQFGTANISSLLLAVLATAILLWLLLTIKPMTESVDGNSEVLSVFDVRPEAPTPIPPPEPRRVPDQADIIDTSAPRPANQPLIDLPAAAAPAAPPIPIAQIDLALIERPSGDGEAGVLEEGNDGRSRTGDGPGFGSSGTGNGGIGRGLGGENLFAEWSPQMDFTQLDRYYPAKANELGIVGSAFLKCRALRRDRVRNCSIVAEAPDGYGFGAAAIRAERHFRVRLRDQKGTRVYNRWMIIEIAYEGADE